MESQKSQTMDEFKKIFFQIYQLVSDQNVRLNDLVEDENTIMVPDDETFREKFVPLMNALLKTARNIRRTHEPEEFLAEISSMKNEDNGEYIEWIFDYMEKSYVPYQEARPFREMDLEAFQSIVDFCVQNYILQTPVLEEIPLEWKEKVCELAGLKRIINCYIGWQLWENCSPYQLNMKMSEMFDLGEKYVSIIQENLGRWEDKIWRIYLFRRLKSIENCLDELHEQEKK